MLALAQSWLRTEHQYLSGPSALDVLGLLHPDSAKLEVLCQLIDQITEHGLEPVLTDYRREYEAAAILSAWVNTPAWMESRAFLHSHRELLDDQTVHAQLEDLKTPEARQHLAILQLCRATSIGTVYDQVIDPSMAADAAMAAVETGDEDRLDLLFTAAPALLRMPFVTRYLVAIRVTLGRSADQEAEAFMRQAAAEATATQREAGALRLARLASRRAAQATELTNLAAILTSDG